MIKLLLLALLTTASAGDLDEILENIRNAHLLTKKLLYSTSTTSVTVTASPKNTLTDTTLRKTVTQRMINTKTMAQEFPDTMAQILPEVVAETLPETGSQALPETVVQKLPCSSLTVAQAVGMEIAQVVAKPAETVAWTVAETSQASHPTSCESDENEVNRNEQYLDMTIPIDSQKHFDEATTLREEEDEADIAPHLSDRVLVIDIACSMDNGQPGLCVRHYMCDDLGSINTDVLGKPDVDYKINLTNHLHESCPMSDLCCQLPRNHKTTHNESPTEPVYQEERSQLRLEDDVSME